MAKLVKWMACLFLCVWAACVLQPCCPRVRFQAPREVSGMDGRLCWVVAGTVDGKMSPSAMDAWIRQAFAAFDATMSFEWRDGRLRVAAGTSPLVSESLPGTSMNLQGMVRYDSGRDETELVLAYPALPTEGW